MTDHMTRGEIIALVGGAAAWPLAVRAQAASWQVLAGYCGLLNRSS
jgi:hypothetical protein